MPFDITPMMQSTPEVISYNAEGRNDQIEQWAQNWTERFRLDAQEVDEEVHTLCEKIRARLSDIESSEM